MATEHPQVCPQCGTALLGAVPSCPLCGKLVVGEPTAAPSPAGPAPAAAPGAIPQRKGPSPWVILLMLVLLGWCAWTQVFAPSLWQTRARNSYDVVYRVSGTAHAIALTYSDASGDTAQQHAKTIPWSKAFTVHPGQVLFVSAQNEGSAGSVTCEIMLNGAVVKSSTAAGTHTAAACRHNV